MRLPKVITAIAALCAFLPGTASASTWVLSFSGPQSAIFVINDLEGTPYVGGFWASGAESYGRIPAAVAPNWTSTLPDIPANDLSPRLLSTVTLSDTGGTIKIGPSFEYVGHFDGEFNLTLNYTLSTPEPVGSVFTDSAITGNYTYSYFVNASVLGPGYNDFGGAGGGSFTGLTAYVPEPATWAMLIAGLFGGGIALRLRRASRTKGLAPG